MTKFFKKSKKPYLGAILGSFGHIWAEMNFPGEKGSVSFQIFQLSTILPKIRKNYSAISEKNAKMTDGQMENGDFIGPSLGRGSNKSRMLRRFKYLKSIYHRRALITCLFLVLLIFQLVPDDMNKFLAASLRYIFASLFCMSKREHL